MATTFIMSTTFHFSQCREIFTAVEQRNLRAHDSAGLVKTVWVSSFPGVFATLVSCRQQPTPPSTCCALSVDIIHHCSASCRYVYCTVAVPSVNAIARRPTFTLVFVLLPLKSLLCSSACLFRHLICFIFAGCAAWSSSSILHLLLSSPCSYPLVNRLPIEVTVNQVVG